MAARADVPLTIYLRGGAGVLGVARIWGQAPVADSPRDGALRADKRSATAGDGQRAHAGNWPKLRASGAVLNLSTGIVTGKRAFAERVSDQAFEFSPGIVTGRRGAGVRVLGKAPGCTGLLKRRSARHC